MSHQNEIWYAAFRPKVKLVCERTDITQLLIKAEWSGNKEEVARRLTFSLVDSPNDHYLSRPQLNIEDMIQFYVAEQREDVKNKDEVFRGYIVEITRSLTSNEVQYIAFDAGFYLQNSQIMKKFVQKTPQDVVRSVCAEIGIPVLKLAEGKPYDRIHDGDTVYEVIMTGYTIQSKKDGNQYMMKFDKGALSVVKKGDYVCPYMLTAGDVVTDTEYKETIVGSISKVKAYGHDRSEKGTFELEGKDKIKGTLQAILQTDDADIEAQAKAMLKGIQKTASMSGLGRLDCITGNACVVEEPYTKLKGLFYIDEDTHTFDNGTHTMQLTLSYQNIMDKVLAGQEKEETSSASVGSSNAATVYNWFRANGFSAASACGIMGNMSRETGDTFDPKIRQNGVGPGTGLCQWEDGYSGRWNQLTAWANSEGKDPWTINTQLEFIIYEVEKYGWFADVGGLTGFKKLTDVHRAADLFLRDYERAGIAAVGVMYSAADKYYNMWSQYTEVPKESIGGNQGTGILGHPVPGVACNNPWTCGHWPGCHIGADFACPIGTPVLAADGGTVVHAGWGEHETYGISVYIDHGNGYKTRYAHLSVATTVAGQGVEKGQKIGEVGSTGCSTGPHVHFEVYQNGVNVNPLNYIRG